MRCDTVIHELATPSGAIDRSAMADHIAGCSRCAAFAAQGEQLQRVWDLTRPAEPSAEAFDSLWANVVSAVDSGQPATIAIQAARPWRRWGVVAMVTAQAAALLLAAGSALRTHPREVRPPAEPVSVAVASNSNASSPLLDFTAEEGTTLIITLDGLAGDTPQVRVTDRITPSDDSPTDMVAVDLDVLNYMESL